MTRVREKELFFKKGERLALTKSLGKLFEAWQ